jgi:hypothetical protein
VDRCFEVIVFAGRASKAGLYLKSASRLKLRPDGHQGRPSAAEYSAAALTMFCDFGPVSS